MRCRANSLELMRLRICCQCIGITTCVQLNHGCADMCGGLHRLDAGIDKQRNLLHARIGQSCHRMFYFCHIAHHIQTAFGGDFFTLLRHEANVARRNAASMRNHVIDNRGFEIHVRVQCVIFKPRRQLGDIGILNVPTVFAQMHGD